MRRHLFLAALLATACSGTENFAGVYTATFTLESEQCGLPNWTGGAVMAQVPLTITTDPNDPAFAQLVFGGSFGAMMSSYSGSNTVSGGVNDNTFSEQTGPGGFISGGDPSCGGGSYVVADVSARLDGDTLTGNVQFLRNCAVGCNDTADFTATRPSK